ncbi:DNA-protecting protein DprA [Levilactobacillus brevis]|nr:DNA-protecting protein DprA [Levilactobacillus brevis]
MLAYPEQLRETYAPPVVLYYLGDLRWLTGPQLAVVGSRQPSPYALRAMRRLLPQVVRQQVCLVSGLAQGVDTLAHQAALAHRGKTIAVIGTGLDHCYPAGNRDLMTELAHHHLVISEYPWGRLAPAITFQNVIELSPGSHKAPWWSKPLATRAV